MSDNYEVPANHEVNYFALDFGRAKEVYTQWYYCEIAIDCDTFNQLIQSKVRECVTQGISDNNIFTNDWKIIEALVLALESAGFIPIKLNTLWLANLMNEEESVHSISLYQCDTAQENSPMLLRSFNEVYQDVFQQALVDLNRTSPIEIENALSTMNHSVLGFQECIDWFYQNGYEFVGFHSTFFGCTQRISSYWSAILGEQLYQQILLSLNTGNQQTGFNKSKFDVKNDEDLPF